MAVEVFSGTEAIGATEHSFTTDTTGPDVETSDGDFLLILDLSDMVTGDDFRIRIYEKVRSGGTQRVLHEWSVVGPQSSLWSMLTPLPLMHGWDMTGYAVSGTITVEWSIRAMGSDTSALASDVTAIKAKTDNLPSDPADASVVAGLIAAVDTKVDDLPTNAELATALGTADDAVLAQVALVKAVTDKLDDTLEDDAGTFRFTANALEEGGGGGPTASDIADEVETRTIAAVTLVNGLAANTVTASALAADAVTEIQNGLATAANLATAQTSINDLPTNAELATALGTADDAVLTQVALVKAKTDSLTFTVTGKVDANITHVNDVEVVGNGETGTEWGPAP